MSLVITPPSVSMPSESGVTSSSRHVLDVALEHAGPGIAAPMATASSGLTSFLGSLPKNSRTLSITLGMRVWPPTRITSLISSSLTPASLTAMRAGLDGLRDELVDQRLELGAGDLSSSVLGARSVRCDVGQVSSVCCEDDSSIFAFSAAPQPA